MFSSIAHLRRNRSLAVGGVMFVFVGVSLTTTECLGATEPADSVVSAADDAVGQEQSKTHQEKLSRLQEIQREAALKREEQRRRHLAQHYQMEGRFLAHHLSRSTDPVQAFEGGLALISESFGDRRTRDELVRYAERFANFEWRPEKGESAEDFAARIARELDIPEDRSIVRLRRLATNYEEIAGEKWSLAWRLDRKRWISIAASLIRSGYEMNPDLIWDQKAQDDKDHAADYSLCYLAVARAGHVKPQQFDRKLLTTFLKPHRGNSQESLYWQAFALDTLVQIGVESQDELRVSLRDELLHNLKSADLRLENRSGDFELPAILGRLVAKGDVERERDPLLRTVLAHPEPYIFKATASAGGVDSEALHDWFLRKEVDVEFRAVPVSEAIRDMLGKVELPVILDAAAANDMTQISLTASGGWGDVLAKVLDASDQQWENLEGNVCWVGPKSRQEKARRIASAAESHVPGDSSRVALSLRNSATLTVNETSVRDTLAQLARTHNIAIHSFTDVDDEKLTFDTRNIPLFLLVALIAEQVQLDWAADRDAVVLGAEEDIEEYQARATRRVRRLDELRVGSRELADKLSHPDRVEFVDVPLVDVCELFSDSHELPIYLVSGGVDFENVNAELDDRSLLWMLDVLLQPLKLHWDSDGTSVFVGRSSDLEELSRRRRARALARRTYPMRVARALQTPVEIRGLKLTLPDVVGQIRESTSVRVVLQSTDPDLAQTEMTGFFDLPLDEALDVLGLKLGFRWNLVGNEIHIERPADRR